MEKNKRNVQQGAYATSGLGVVDSPGKIPATRWEPGQILKQHQNRLAFFVVVVLTLTHRYNAIPGHKTGSNNSGVTSTRVQYIPYPFPVFAAAESNTLFALLLLLLLVPPSAAVVPSPAAAASTVCLLL